MHRHGYIGRKFGRERDQRRALLKNLATSVILHEEVETTLPKAKTIRPYIEKLVTKAKKGGLHNRRQIISSLNSIEAVDKLFDEVVPSVAKRNSGFLRIKRTGLRKGDSAQLATISFVDEIKEQTVKNLKEAPKAKAKVPAKKEAK